jgi:hypothetical protein
MGMLSRKSINDPEVGGTMRLWHRFIHPISAHFRSKRAVELLKHYPGLAEWTICDLGGSRHFWQESKLDVDPERITIVNISLDEVEAYGQSSTRQIRTILYDGRNIPFSDGSFDLLVCNSLLEHVAPADRDSLCREMRRVAKRIYLQTPAFEFPMEPHFILPFVQWFPRKFGRVFARLGLWNLLSRPSEAVFDSYFDDTYLLTRREMEQLFPEVDVKGEQFAGLTKSYLVFWSVE